MPQTLLDFGVGKALMKYIDDIRSSSPLNIKYVDDTTDESIPDEINIGIYRVVQEGLNNAIKHSGASNIELSITQFQDVVSVLLKDNGKGFDVTQRKKGSGLINMKERCKVLNGYLEIHSDSEGTTIEIEIPIPHD
jgi:signal transduction histidine kinase